MRNIVKKQAGITLIALVVTIIVLIILAGVSINMLVGENGIINMAQRAKNETEQAAKDEQEALAGMFGKSFSDYNGQLHVEGTNIVNQYGETIQLRGLSTGNGNGRASLTEKYYNKESLSNIKNWGANIFRIAVDTSPSLHGYVENKEIIQDVYRIADICVELDMYVIIDWHVLNEGDPNVYKEEAKEFFEQVATRYKDVPNVLYEICNEPNGDNITWEEVKNYANEIIPIIRNISNKAIIITGTPSWSQDLNSVAEDKLEYDNIMYTYHRYFEYVENDILEQLEIALDKKIPIFVTEWGTSTVGSTGTFFLEYSNLFVEFMKENNISWCNWNLTDANELVSAVKYNQWNNSLNEDILTESGLYIKQLLEGSLDTSISSIMMGYDTNYAFWQDEFRPKITSIIVQDSIDEQRISDAIQSWDVSFTNGLNNVMAYIEDDGSGEGTYILYIAGKGIVYSPPNAHNLFSDFINVKNIDLKNFRTSNTNNLAYMFYKCNNLDSLDLSMFDTANVKNMAGMFSDCNNLSSINLDSFNTAKTNQMHQMFAHCSSLKSLDLTSFKPTNLVYMYQMFAYDTNLETIKFSEEFDTSKVDDMKEVFRGCESLIELDLSMFNTSNVKSMKQMFLNCKQLNTLDLTSFNTDKVEDMSGMFEGCEKLSNVNLSSFNTSNVINMSTMFDRCRQLVNLDLSNFNIDKVENVNYMFRNLNNIENLKLNNMNFNNVTSYTDMFARAKTNLEIIVKDEEAKKFIESRLEDVGINGNISVNIDGDL